MAKTMLDILGTMLVVVGIAGFVSPAAGGAHLSPAHNSLHILSGLLALWIGLRSSTGGSQSFSWVMACAYGLLAMAGFVLGRPGAGFRDEASDPKLLTVIPDLLELGQSDHVLNLGIALVFASVAVMARPARQHEPAHRAT